MVWEVVLLLCLLMFIRGYTTFVALVRAAYVSSIRGYLYSRFPDMIPSDPYFTECEICWIKVGFIRVVRNQGACQSCSVFAVCDVISAVYAIYKNILVLLAPQHVIDCMPNPNSDTADKNGCKTACQKRVYKFAKRTGIHQESDYPYKARAEVCKSASLRGCTKYKIDNFLTNAEDPRNVLLSHPITARLKVYAPFTVFAGEGVFQPPIGVKSEGTHCVLVLGYGTTQDGEEYYLIKNSWGTGWGFHGFAKVSPSLLEKFAYPILD